MYFVNFSLASGVLYPAYASFKAVRTRNMRAYVRFGIDFIMLHYTNCVVDVCVTLVHYLGSFSGEQLGQCKRHLDLACKSLFHKPQRFI